jgi:hypothetical protein
MADLAARHYLKIYRIKLAMAEDGTTRPNAKGIQFIRDVVAALAPLDADTPIRLETSDTEASFRDAATGRLLARLLLVDDV